jgi:hypothetical protein
MATDNWRAAKGAHFEVLYPSVTVRRAAPKTVGHEKIPHELTAERHTVHPELFLAVLPGARVLGPNGTVITDDGGVVEESTWPARYLPGERARSTLWLPTCRDLGGLHYTIASPYWSGYYHWVADVLPRLFALDILTSNDIRILVNGPLSAWQQESLELLGFDTGRFVPVGDGYVRIEVLYLPSFLGEPSTHPFACQWLRQRLLPAMGAPRRGARLYVTRRLARRRRLVNEGQIEPILRDRGFEVVEAERLTFSEQVRLFAEAAVIAGPHGAGLTNAIFAPVVCQILELFQPTYVLSSTYKIATCVGQDYWFLVGEAAPGGGADSANTTDIRIDPEKFAACLDVMLASSDRSSPNGLMKRGELIPDVFFSGDRNGPDSRRPSVPGSTGESEGSSSCVPWAPVADIRRASACEDSAANILFNQLSTVLVIT